LVSPACPGLAMRGGRMMRGPKTPSIALTPVREKTKREKEARNVSEREEREREREKKKKKHREREK